MAAATGNMKRAARMGHMRDLRRAMRGPREHRDAVEITRRTAQDGAPAAPVDLGKVGIAVVVSDEKAGAGWPVVTGPSDG